jgi:hypothetical protein
MSTKSAMLRIVEELTLANLKPKHYESLEDSDNPDSCRFDELGGMQIDLWYLANQFEIELFINNTEILISCGLEIEGVVKTIEELKRSLSV